MAKKAQPDRAETNDDRIRILLDEEANYRETVQALTAFAALVVHDGTRHRDGSFFGFGRRMNPPKGDPVTPDFVGQTSHAFGIAAEVKKTLPKSTELWNKIIDQLRTYDDTLLGWKTDDEKIAQSDAVLLIHYSRSRSFKTHLESVQQKSPGKVGPHSSIVEFNLVLERSPYVSFRRESGTIREKTLNDRLTNGVPVPLHKVLETFSNLQYYDARPPTLTLLVNLWSDYFPSLSKDVPYDELAKARKIIVSATTATRELQKAYGSGTMHSDHRSCAYPEFTWVRDALDRLVEFDLADKKSDDEYIVAFKKTNKDVREFFANLELKKGPGVRSKKRRELKQGSLLEGLGA